MMSQTTTGAAPAGRPAQRGRGPILFSLIVVDSVLFASGAVAHMGVPIPLGFGTWNEPFVLPAATVEGIGAVLLLGAVMAFVFGWRRSLVITQVALWYCFAGVLWGMALLALRTIPQAHTVTNDFLHIGMLLTTTIALALRK